MRKIPKVMIFYRAQDVMNESSTEVLINSFPALPCDTYNQWVGERDFLVQGASPSSLSPSFPPSNIPCVSASVLVAGGEDAWDRWSSAS